MVGQLVLLKWRLVANAVRTDARRAVGLALATLLLAGAATYLGWQLWRAGRPLSDPAAGELSLWAVSLAWVAWALLPVLLFPLDEGLDPARFIHLPIDRFRLLAGLVFAGLVTPSAVIPLAVVGTSALLFGPSPMALPAVAGSLLLFSLSAQALSLAVSAVMRSRHWRDLVVLVVAGLGITGFVVHQLISRVVASRGLESALLSHPLSPWTLLVPPANFQGAVVAWTSGDPVAGLIHLGAGAAWLLLLGTVWLALLERLSTDPEPPPASAGIRRRGLVSRWWWSPLMVMTRKELRTYRRDPRMRAVWTGGLVFLGILGAWLALGMTTMEILRRSQWLVPTTGFVVLLIGQPITLNQLGWERQAGAFLFALPLRAGTVLAGKNLATVVALALETAVLGILAAALTGGWDRLPLLAAFMATATGCLLAVGNLVSVIAPLRLPPPGTDIFAQASEQGCLALAAQLTGFFVTAVLLIPPASALALAEMGVLHRGMVAGGALIWGGSIYLVATLLAARLLHRRTPETLAAVVPD